MLFNTVIRVCCLVVHRDVTPWLRQGVLKHLTLSGLEFCNHYFNALAAEKQQIYKAHSAAPSGALQACRPAVFGRNREKLSAVQKTFCRTVESARRSAFTVHTVKL